MIGPSRKLKSQNDGHSQMEVEPTQVPTIDRPPQPTGMPSKMLKSQRKRKVFMMLILKRFNDICVHKLHIIFFILIVDPPLSEGLLISLADAISKCAEWKDILPFLGLEDSPIAQTINDEQVMPLLRVLKMLQYWQTNIMQNDQSCRVTLVGVLQKFRMTQGLQILGQTVEEDDHIPNPSKDVHLISLSHHQFIFVY